MNSEIRINRREFTKMGSVFTLGASLGSYNSYGAPGVTEANVAEKYARLIPADKQLDPEWRRALFTRGNFQFTSERKALDHIGMPVGGMYAGTVYLGGDGRLWYWNIRNDDREGVDPRKVDFKGKKVGNRDGTNFIEPVSRSYPFEQSFGLRINGQLRTLDADGFETVSFVGQYPIGEVSYADSECPVSVQLSAFSPFIPMNTADSSLPVTVMSYRVRNDSSQTVECDLLGWSENPVCLGKPADQGTRRNALSREGSFVVLNCSAESAQAGVQSSDRSDVMIEDFEGASDFGTMALAVLADADAQWIGAPDQAKPVGEATTQSASGSLKDELVGSVGRSVTLQPGEEQTVEFVLAWNFPNLSLRKMPNVGREYASRFDDALAVIRYVAEERERLFSETKLWRDTWYDSSLPYWFLDRTMANTSILATTTAYRFRDGRFWAWEGVGCCPGTCTHVWHYAQAPGRLFPDVERQQRENVDFGLAMHDDGGIGFRSTLKGSNHAADDGQCGRILGAYREHQMSQDSALLERNWPRIKKAMRFLIKRDLKREGILQDAQHNTLDASWYGRVSFLASLYLAALRACEAMAIEMNDADFARECKAIADTGAETILELYNGEYFFHELDPDKKDRLAVGTGCYIDQVLGQFWAHQVGLGYITDEEKIKSALKALYKYNFAPHVGRFREVFSCGRWYAMDDDKGLIMCTWPKGGLNKKWHDAWQFQYFNECMSGFEWQAAAHMISEGLVEEGLTISRAIHDRYDASLRNPYNEVECSDHYSRAMASYGTFLAACGYESHGPQGYLGFAPKVRDGNTFKCAFTAAGGWGSYEETSDGKQFNASLSVKWGAVKLVSLGLEFPDDVTVLTVTLDGESVPASIKTMNGRRRVVLDQGITLTSEQVLNVRA